jgi:LruC domain-containing protein
MKTKYFFLLFGIIFIASCVKMPKNNTEIPSIVEGEIPYDFDWKTIKTIDLTVNVTAIDPQSSNKVHIIKVYNSPLMNTGALIATGAAKPNSPYNVKISVATPTEKLYIHEIKPNGLASVSAVDVNSTVINTQLTKSGNDNLFAAQAASFGANIASFEYAPIAIPSQFDVVVNDNSSLNIVGFNTGESSAYGNIYKSYYIPAGVNRTASIDFGNYREHAVLYVAGSININSNISLNKMSIVVLSGGSINFKGFSIGVVSEDFPALYIQSGGSANISNQVSSNNATFVNKGTLIVEKKIELSTNTKFYNDGNLQVSSGKNRGINVTNSTSFTNTATINATDINLTSNASFTNAPGAVVNIEKWYQSNGTILNNHGEIAASKEFGNSGGGTINNFCHITANLSSIQSLTAHLEEGSLWNTQKLEANNSTINMVGGSMFVTGQIDAIYGLTVTSSSPNYALFKSTGNVPNLTWAASTFSGSVEFVYTGLTSSNRSNYEPAIAAGAILGDTQTQNIPGTSCNGSLGQIEEDDDPGSGETGGETTFANYFPSQSGWGTYAFEDLWPSKGDYDLNDMVFKFRVSFISNSSNQVTRIIFDYRIEAVGATKHAAVAFQLDNVLASNVSSVSGQILGGGMPFVTRTNGTETGVDQAVIPVFNNPKDIIAYPGFLNTDKGGQHISTPEGQVIIDFVTPVAQSLLTMDNFNMFISADSRGKEIHLPGYAPTSKFDMSLVIGKSLHPEDVFKYNDGMMWGLMFPDVFNYPAEKETITNAYTHFSEWATSGGTIYPNWYSSEEGFRNEELIY